MESVYPMFSMIILVLRYALPLVVLVYLMGFIKNVFQPSISEKEKSKEQKQEYVRAKIMQLLKQGPKTEQEIKSITGENEMDIEIALLFLELGHEVSISDHYPQRIVEMTPHTATL